MQEEHEMHATELSKNDKKILDKYSRGYQKLPEGANPISEAAGENSTRRKEL